MKMRNILNFINNKNVLWNMVGITLNSFYSLVLIIFITRFNGLEASGQFSFAFYLASIFQTIGNYGGRIYQVSDYEGKYFEDSYVSLKFITTGIMLLLSFVFCFLNSYDSFKFSLILILIIYRVFESISDSYYGILQKNGRLDIVGKSMTLKVIMGLFLFTILDILFKDIQISSLGFVFAFLFFLLIYDIRKAQLYHKVHIKFNVEVVSLLRECFKIFMFAFLSLLILNATRYAVDMNLTDSIQGIFGILIMPSSLIALSTQFIVQPMIKTLSDQFNTKGIHIFSKQVSKMLILVIFLGLICSICTYFVGVDILTILYSVDLLPYRFSLTAMIIAGIFSGITTMLSTILTIMRKLNLQFWGYSLSTILAFLVSFLTIMYFKTIDAALFAYFISMMIQFFIMMGIYYKQIKYLRKVDFNE